MQQHSRGGDDSARRWRDALIFAICFASFYIGLIAFALLIGSFKKC